MYMQLGIATAMTTWQCSRNDNSQCYRNYNLQCCRNDKLPFLSPLQPPYLKI